MTGSAAVRSRRSKRVLTAVFTAMTFSTLVLPAQRAAHADSWVLVDDFESGQAVGSRLSRGVIIEDGKAIFESYDFLGFTLGGSLYVRGKYAKKAKAVRVTAETRDCTDTLFTTLGVEGVMGTDARGTVRKAEMSLTRGIGFFVEDASIDLDVVDTRETSDSFITKRKGSGEAPISLADGESIVFTMTYNNNSATVKGATFDRMRIKPIKQMTTVQGKERTLTVSMFTIDSTDTCRFLVDKIEVLVP